MKPVPGTQVIKSVNKNAGFNLKERLNNIAKWKTNSYIKKLMR